MPLRPTASTPSATPTAACTTSEAFYGDHHNGPMTMDYFVWALTNGSETVVVDLGFTEAVGTARGRQFLRCPSTRASPRSGVDCGPVQHVVLSHFHYDHVGNYALVPQRHVLRAGRGDGVLHRAQRRPRPPSAHSVEVEDICALIRLNYDGRLIFVDGSREVVPGVSVHKVGGHTAGMQIVTVAHAKGRAVVASDASHYYRNFEERIPFNTLHDLPRDVPRLRAASASSRRARSW